MSDCFFFTNPGTARCPKSIHCMAARDSLDLPPNHTTRCKWWNRLFLLCPERPHSCLWGSPSPQRVILCSTTAMFPEQVWLKVTDSVKVTNSLKIHIIPTTSKQTNSLFTLKHTNFISPYALPILVYTCIVCIFLWLKSLCIVFCILLLPA